MHRFQTLLSLTSTGGIAVLTSNPLISALFTPFGWRQADYQVDCPTLSGARRDSLLFLCLQTGNIKGKPPVKATCSGSCILFICWGPPGPLPDRDSCDKQLPINTKHSDLGLVITPWQSGVWGLQNHPPWRLTWYRSGGTWVYCILL